jgi:hypothetical protein
MLARVKLSRSTTVESCSSTHETSMTKLMRKTTRAVSGSPLASVAWTESSHVLLPAQPKVRLLYAHQSLHTRVTRPPAVLPAQVAMARQAKTIDVVGRDFTGLDITGPMQMG